MEDQPVDSVPTPHEDLLAQVMQRGARAERVRIARLLNAEAAKLRDRREWEADAAVRRVIAVLGREDAEQ